MVKGNILEEAPRRHAGKPSEDVLLLKSESAATAAAKSATRLPVPGILQARTLEWVPFPSPMHESEK